MNPKTNYSFEVQYPARPERPDGAQGRPHDVMANLGAALQELFAARDGAASVVVSDSHKGSGHKIVQLTTTLEEPLITEALQAFSMRNGVSVQAIE